MKQSKITLLGLAVFLVIFFAGAASLEAGQFNLFEPDTCVIEIDGKKYSLVISKYNPPYISPSHLLNDRSREDLSTPEGTHLALWSAVDRDKNWYLSLHDGDRQKRLFEADKKSGGRILGEPHKGKSLRNPVEDGSYEEFLYKVEFRDNNKEYTIIQSRRYFKKQEFPGPTFLTFVRSKNKWFRTDDLREHPVKSLVGLKTYEEMKKICDEGVWTKE